MADKILLRAYKGQAKSVNLSNRNLPSVPNLIGKLSKVKSIDLKNNKICALPKDFSAITQVIY